MGDKIWVEIEKEELADDRPDYEEQTTHDPLLNYMITAVIIVTVLLLLCYGFFKLATLSV